MLSTSEFVVLVFVLLIGGLALPLSYAARMTIFMLLIGLIVMTMLGGGMQYLTGLFQ